MADDAAMPTPAITKLPSQKAPAIALCSFCLTAAMCAAGYYLVFERMMKLERKVDELDYSVKQSVNNHIVARLAQDADAAAPDKRAAKRAGGKPGAKENEEAAAAPEEEDQEVDDDEDEEVPPDS
jgi:outer membrane murein-binding lipoprotein Lpp